MVEDVLPPTPAKESRDEEDKMFGGAQGSWKEWPVEDGGRRRKKFCSSWCSKSIFLLFVLLDG